MTNFRKLQNEELNRISTEAFKKAPKLPVVILLDHVRSQNNVGSVFRTSDAFRIEKIFLCGITSTPENREVHKTALGAEDAVDWEYVKDTTEAVDRLKKEGYRIFAIEQAENTTSLENFYPRAARNAFARSGDGKDNPRYVRGRRSGLCALPRRTRRLGEPPLCHTYKAGPHVCQKRLARRRTRGRA